MINRIAVVERPRAVESERFLATFIRPAKSIPYGASAPTTELAVQALVELIGRHGDADEIWALRQELLP